MPKYCSTALLVRPFVRKIYTVYILCTARHSYRTIYDHGACAMRVWLRSLARASLTPKGFSSGPSIQSSISGRLSSSTAMLEEEFETQIQTNVQRTHTQRKCRRTAAQRHKPAENLKHRATASAPHTTRIYSTHPHHQHYYHCTTVMSPKNRAIGPPFPIFLRQVEP